MYIYYLFSISVSTLSTFYKYFTIIDILVMIRNKLQVGFHYLLLSLHQPEISLNAIY